MSNDKVYKEILTEEVLKTVTGNLLYTGSFILSEGHIVQEILNCHIVFPQNCIRIKPQHFLKYFYGKYKDSLFFHVWYLTNKGNDTHIIKKEIPFELIYCINNDTGKYKDNLVFKVDFAEYPDLIETVLEDNRIFIKFSLKIFIEMVVKSHFYIEVLP